MPRFTTTLPALAVLRKLAEVGIQLVMSVMNRETVDGYSLSASL